MKAQETHTKLPDEPAALRVIPMPSDTNAEGDIFGGWLLSQMDLAGASLAYREAQNRIVTVGIDGMSFHKPVFVGDEVSFYTRVQSVGRTSIAIHVEAWARPRLGGAEARRVTEGIFTYVAIGADRNPVPVKRKV